MTEQLKSWRDQIKVHPAADLFPMMGADELKALGEDIKKNGLHIPVILWQADTDALPMLLDGRNRLDASEAVGLRVLDKGLLTGCFKLEIGRDPYDLVLSANVHRRHLTTEQKRDLIAKVLKAQPSKSNRTIAKQAKVDHKTVGTVRGKLEACGEIPRVSTVEDTKGRKQPTRKPATKKRRDADDCLAEKKARMAAKTDTDAPAPPPTEIIPLKQQMKALSSELAKFRDDYFARVREWHTAHCNNEDKGLLVRTLEEISYQMRMLARDIDGRNWTREEATVAEAEASA